MQSVKWNEDWKFWPDGDAFALVWNVPETARKVTLPHDAMIEKPADRPSEGVEAVCRQKIVPQKLIPAVRRIKVFPYFFPYQGDFE